MEPLLKIRDLSVDFISGKRSTRAVNNISLEVNRGEILALVGESGSGKSVTSLSILKLLPQPPAQFPGGSILFSEDGKQSTDLLTLSPKQMQRIRGNSIAMIFQEPMTSLNPVMRCGEQVMEALLIHRDITKAEAKKQTIAWFEKVKLPDPQNMFDRYPHQLSGGQKQRVMIAMAMCCEPSLLICDEPTTALDVTVQKTILELIQDLQKSQNMGVIFITHDLGVVAGIADRVAIMYKGEIVEQNEAKIIFQSPKHPYTQALIACRPSRHPRGEKLPVVADFLTEGSVEIPHAKVISPKTEFQQEVLVKVENLTVNFPGKTNLFGKVLDHFTAVNDVSFEIKKGETLGLVGESGCGKTTLGRTLLRLIEPSSGKIIYNNQDITALEKEKIKELRKNIQLVFQDPYSSLNPKLNIGAAISEPMLFTGDEASAKKRREKTASLLEKVSLSPDLANRYPHEFSGGQRQRIVIARALALDPAFLVCDESVSALDVSVQAQVLNLLNDLKRELNLTMLFISHDLSVVRYMSDRIMVMHKGKIVETGNADDVYYHPQNEYTKGLVESIPEIGFNG